MQHYIDGGMMGILLQRALTQWNDHCAVRLARSVACGKRGRFVEPLGFSFIGERDFIELCIKLRLSGVMKS